MDTKTVQTSDSPFVRYRHGIELRIDPKIKESVKIFVDSYRKNGEESFRSLITDISDGSGLGISKESTWFKAIKELFEHLREYDPRIQKLVKDQYTEYLNILAEGESSAEVWVNLKKYIENNIDSLSLWQFSHFKSLSEISKPFRDKDGKVYEKSSLGKVEIIDGKTLAEAKYDYVVEDICNKYGSIGLLLRFTRLIFIENSITGNLIEYPLVKFVMSEDGNTTWFLQGYWQIRAVNQERNIKWHPSDFYTDLSWLESDLIAQISNNMDSESKNSTHPSAPIIREASDLILFQKSTVGFKFQYEIALDTNVFITTGHDEIPDEIYIDFEGRLIRWINGSMYRCPVLIISTNEEDYDDAMSISKKFISKLIFENPHISIKEGGSVGHPINYYPAMIRQPRLASITTISSNQFSTSPVTSQNKWLVLSFYKEAQNSDSIFYRFLNFFKIIQRAFLSTTGSEDSSACVSWIDQQIASRNTESTIIEIITDASTLAMTPSQYLQHTCRDAASHVGILDRRVPSGYPTINPDNLSDRQRYQRAIVLVENLARKTIQDSMHG